MGHIKSDSKKEGLGHRLKKDCHLLRKSFASSLKRHQFTGESWGHFTNVEIYIYIFTISSPDTGHIKSDLKKEGLGHRLKKDYHLLRKSFASSLKRNQFTR